MPLEEMTCKHCGSALKIDAGKKFAICEYCGTAYQITNVINKILQQQKREEENKSEYDKELEKAAIYEKLGERNKAWCIYKWLIDNYPGDYRAYEMCWRMEPYLRNSKMYKSMIILCPEKEREYKYHYDLLVQKEKEEAIAAELRRKKK